MNLKRIITGKSTPDIIAELDAIEAENAAEASWVHSLLSDAEAIESAHHLASARVTQFQKDAVNDMVAASRKLAEAAALRDAFERLRPQLSQRAEERFKPVLLKAFGLLKPSANSEESRTLKAVEHTVGSNVAVAMDFIRAQFTA